LEQDIKYLTDAAGPDTTNTGHILPGICITLSVPAGLLEKVFKSLVTALI
jgi:hypothetical protein